MKNEYAYEDEELRDEENYYYPDEEQHYQELLELEKQTDERVPFSYTFKLLKSAADPTVVYGVVYPACPENTWCETDSQNDFASVSDVQSAAHDFLDRYAKGQARLTVEHSGPAKASVVENFLAPAPFELDGQLVTKGSWCAGVRLNDPALVKAVNNGSLNSFSIGGSGLRILNPYQVAKSVAVPTQLKELNIDEISLVGKGANRRKFVLLQKADLEKIKMEKSNKMNELEIFEQIANEKIEKSGRRLTWEQAYTEAIFENPEAYSSYLAKMLAGESVYKQELPSQGDDDGEDECECPACPNDPSSCVAKEDPGCKCASCPVAMCANSPGVVKAAAGCLCSKCKNDPTQCSKGDDGCLCDQCKAEGCTKGVSKSMQWDLGAKAVALEAALSHVKKAAEPEIYAWTQLAKDRIQKSGGALTFEQAFTDVVHMYPEEYDAYVRRISQLHI